MLNRWDHVSKIRDHEVGFGLLTISTSWWGNLTEGEAIGLMNEAFDLRVILFDAAGTDAYNNSRL
jgi:aryl-alcohol dehydrogenase-like predicted oxidoreductase